jgi:hypothetical protein
MSTGFPHASITPSPLLHQTCSGKQPVHPALPEALGLSKQFLRRAKQTVAAAKAPGVGGGLGKLSEALPKTFRLMCDLGHTVGRVVPRG